MKNFLISCAAAAAMVASTGMALAKTIEPAPFPMEYWAAPNFMSNVELSPDGRYVAFMKAESQKGDHVIEVYEATDMSKKPRRIGAKSMNIRGFSWIGDEEIVVSFDKQVSKRIKGFNRGAFRGKLALYSMKTNDFKELTDDNSSMTLANVLPEEPNHVLVRYSEFKEGESFRAPSFYKFNLDRGTKSLVLKGNWRVFNVRFDKNGNPRFATRFDEGSEEFIFLYRRPDEGSWSEYYRLSRDSFERFGYAGMVDEDNHDEIFVTATNGEDRVSLWKFDLTSGTFGKKVYGHDTVDVLGTRRHSNSWSYPGEVTGVRYNEGKRKTVWMDRSEKDVYKKFSDAIPNSHDVYITSRSRDGNTLVVYNTGPRDPGTYYLYNNGQFSLMGSVNALLDGNKLADVEYITYQSRDGKTIPGFVTRPNGPGPHPLIVMPHGGPFVGETVSYDDWGQMLANNGYMVLQPQYRGSQNYGLDFYKAGFIDGGQGGYKMQDDKDDGVKHLIAKGDVDPDRVAMFGWSYGGYAALIAAARSPNLYQCVIAGAAVADNNQQVNYYRNEIEGSQRVEQLKFWDESISPIEEAEKVNVPMLVIHGSVDQRVPVSHSRKYIDELEKHGKDFKYIELENADHFSNTLFYNHKMDAYPAMMDFLKKDCGPGGL